MLIFGIVPASLMCEKVMLMLPKVIFLVSCLTSDNSVKNIQDTLYDGVNSFSKLQHCIIVMMFKSLTKHMAWNMEVSKEKKLFFKRLYVVYEYKTSLVQNLMIWNETFDTFFRRNFQTYSYRVRCQHTSTLLTVYSHAHFSLVSFVRRHFQKFNLDFSSPFWNGPLFKGEHV